MTASNLEGPFEQVLVTHCLKKDSVLGQDGYSVRAASPGANDPETLDWAFKLDAYELPFDMKSGMQDANQAPRRLALVPAPKGRVALVHTSYLPVDTIERPHSYISHILILPTAELNVELAAMAWGASEWQTKAYSGGEKVLQPLDRLSIGGLINEDALAAFLSKGRGSARPARLAQSISPSRVDSAPDTRRQHGSVLPLKISSTRE